LRPTRSGHFLDEAEQAEIERLRREVQKLKAERDTLKTIWDWLCMWALPLEREAIGFLVAS
jgi:hypothetical protein